MARLAQSVERGTFNPKVKGSSPLSGAFWPYWRPYWPLLIECVFHVLLLFFFSFYVLTMYILYQYIDHDR